MNSEEYDFAETVDYAAREALDPIRYGEVESKYSDEAQKKQEMQGELLDNLSTDEDRELVQEYFERVNDMFDKYNGESDSGPSAFLLFVDDETDVVTDNEGYASPLHSPDWSKYEWSENGVPDFYDEDLDQIVHDIMTENDGAMVVGKDGIREDTVKILDSELTEEDYPDIGGTKHEAAVDAMYNNLVNEEGEEVYREALILSGKSGDIRHFRPAEPESDKKYNITEFPYDRQTGPRVPENWRDGLVEDNDRLEESIMTEDLSRQVRL